MIHFTDYYTFQRRIHTHINNSNGGGLAPTAALFDLWGLEQLKRIGKIYTKTDKSKIDRQTALSAHFPHHCTNKLTLCFLSVLTFGMLCS